MSKRNALFIAIIAGIVLAVFFLWPERARADPGFSAHGSIKVGTGVGAGLHRGQAGKRREVHAGGRALHRGLHRDRRGGPRFVDRGFRRDRSVDAHGLRRNRSVGDHGGSRLHGSLLGDRFRFHEHRLVGGGKHARRVLLGDRFLTEQRRRLDAEFLGPRRSGDRRAGKRHGRYISGHNGHVRGGHRAQWLRGERLLLPYGGTDVVVRHVIVPVPVPTPQAARRAPDVPEQSAGLDPRGRVTLVGEEDGIVGDWVRGDTLPAGMPYVALDPVAYGLPEPPRGQRYARVGNDVLRIEVGSRRIAEIVAR